MKHLTLNFVSKKIERVNSSTRVWSLCRNSLQTSCFLSVTACSATLSFIDLFPSLAVSLLQAFFFFFLLSSLCFSGFSAANISKPLPCSKASCQQILFSVCPCYIPHIATSFFHSISFHFSLILIHLLSFFKYVSKLLAFNALFLPC